MGTKKRFQIKIKQKVKRRKRIKELKKKNLNVGEYFYEGHYIGPSKSK